MPKPWGRLRKFLWPSQKSLTLPKSGSSYLFFNWYIILHAMVLTILMMQIIQCFPPFSMNDSTNKNSVFLTLQNPLLPRIHCKKVYFGSVFVFARRLDTFIFTTAKCIIRFLTSSRLDIIIFFFYTILKALFLILVSIFWDFLILNLNKPYSFQPSPQKTCYHDILPNYSAFKLHINLSCLKD